MESRILVTPYDVTEKVEGDNQIKLVADKPEAVAHMVAANSSTNRILRRGFKPAVSVEDVFFIFLGWGKEKVICGNVAYLNDPKAPKYFPGNELALS